MHAHLVSAPRYFKLGTHAPRASCRTVAVPPIYASLSPEPPTTTAATMAQMQPPPPDLFVLVRPPPSSSRSPLDLQIQLLVPSAARGPPPPPPAPRTSSSVSVTQGGQNSSSTSFDAIAAASVTGHGGEDSSSTGVGGGAAASDSLSRSPSLRSTRSRSSTRSTATTESGYTSATGTSTGTGSGGRRKVTPLLNLEYHTVLPTVVTDAGTDQRVARFLKRGIELTGLAVLDPIDLATAHALAASSVPISPVASNQGSTIASTSAAPPSSSSNGNGTNHGGGFFGRFKRFGANSTTSTSSNPAAKVLSSLTAGSSSSSSAEGPSAYALPLLRTRSSHTASPIIHPSRTSLSTPFDPSHPSTATTTSDRGYSFQVRKWIRSEFADASPPKSGFRLEWVRAVRRSPSSRRGGGAGTAATTAGASRASSLSGRSVEVQVADGATATGLSRPASDPSDPAAAGEEPNSRSPSRNDDHVDHHQDPADEINGGGDDDDEEERAWICTLVYPLSGGFAQQHGYGTGRQSTESTRPPPSSSAASHSTSPTSPPSSSSLPTTRRMHLATLQPAPHHPKLVSTLLLPPTLPSIPIGSYSPQRGLLGGVLGPEDLRDLAMVTAMWVAVREGLGALEGVVEQMVGSSHTTSATTTTTATMDGVSGTCPPSSSYPSVPTAEPRTSMSSTNARVTTTTTTTTLAEAASPPSAKAPPVVVSSPRKSAAPPPPPATSNNSSKGSISSNRRKGATGIVSGLFGGGGGNGGGGGGTARGSTLGLRERFAAATAR